MRDKEFYINAIKMDLLRVTTAAGNLKEKFPKISILEFLKHADNDFKKVKLTEREKMLRVEMRRLAKSTDENAEDPHKRLRWAEKVLTIRSRL